MRSIALLVLPLLAVAAVWAVVRMERQSVGSDAPYGATEVAERAPSAELASAPAARDGVRRLERVASEAAAASDFSPEARATTVHLVSAGGGPVEGSLWAHPLSGVPAILDSGPDGRVALPQTRGELYLRAHAPGHALVEELVEPPYPERVEIVLPVGGSISGRVRERSGAPVGGARVLAWPDGRLPGRALQRCNPLPPGLPLLSGESDEEGRFLLEALDPARRYTVFATATGLGLPEPIRSVAPGRAGMEIELAPVHALRLRFAEPDGSELRTAAGLEAAGGTSWILEDSSGVSFFEGWMRERAGLPPERMGCMDLVFLASNDDRGVGPVRVHVAPPGYEPADVEVLVPPFRGELEEQVVAFQPVASGWGTLRVTLETGARSRLARGSVRLALRRLDDGTSFVAPLHLDRRSIATLRGVPAGSYELSLHPVVTVAPRPALVPTHVRIEDGRAAEATLDATLLRSLELDVRVDRVPYRAGVVAEITDVDSAGSQFLVLTGTPHVIDGLTAGRYRVRLWKPFIADGPQPYVSVALDFEDPVVVAFDG